MTVTRSFAHRAPEAVLAPSLGSIAAPAPEGRTVEAPAPRRTVAFTAASLVPGDRAGTWTVTWTAPKARHVKVFVGGERETVARRPAAISYETTGSAPFVLDTERPWVRLEADGGAPVTLTTRTIGLKSATNFRDVGGYRTTDGRWVRMGVVYRAGALTLSPADLDRVARLGLSGDFDLRTTAETTAVPDAVIPGATYHHVDVMADVAGAATMPRVSRPEEIADRMRQTAVDFVDAHTARAAYRDLFTHLATDPGASLFHCTAGKDRTGWAAAVLLTLLGVDARTVMDDYLLSNTCYYDSPAVQAQLDALPADRRAMYAAFVRAEPDYLQAGLDRVEQEYGSMQAYAEQGLGLSPDLVERLRAKLLAD